MSYVWIRTIGRNGKMISKDDFGASAPFKILLEKFGFTKENVINQAVELLD